MKRRCALIFAVAALAGCRHPSAGTSSSGGVAPRDDGAAAAAAATNDGGRREAPCLEVSVDANSAATTAVFEARGRQGGGPTWVAILEAFAHRHGTGIGELKAPPPGYPGFGAPFRITTSRGTTWFTLDEEGDAAVFCAGDAVLLGEVRDDYERANHDRDALAKALDEAAPFGTE